MTQLMAATVDVLRVNMPATVDDHPDLMDRVKHGNTACIKAIHYSKSIDGYICMMNAANNAQTSMIYASASINHASLSIIRTVCDSYM